MKRKFKSIIAIAMALCLSVSMAGCGKEKSIEDLTEKDIEKAISELDESSKKTKRVKKNADLEDIAPFDNLNVAFTGIYPSSTVTISGGNSKVTYTPSVEQNVKNGDVVVITAELSSSFSEKYWLTEVEKEYTVSGISSYATKLDEIPEDLKEKMLKQADDSIKAHCASWAEGNTLKKSEFLGYYFLSSKDGFSQNPFNEIYCVYKITANMTGLKRGGDGKEKETGEETYYTHFKYSNIMLLDENTCSVDLSAGQLTDNRIESDYGYYNLIATFYKFNGYKDLDSMFNATVTSKIQTYNYESTVE